MGLFIKTYNRNGGMSLVNIDNVENISLSNNDGVTYTPTRGTNPNASYYPTIAYCTKANAEIIFDEITNFIATNTSGVYDAYTRVKELNNNNRMAQNP